MNNEKRGGHRVRDERSDLSDCLVTLPKHRRLCRGRQLLRMSGFGLPGDWVYSSHNLHVSEFCAATMSLRRNLNIPGHAHELTFSCYKGLALLSKDRTRQWFSDALNDSCTKLHFRLWAYVIMPEHVHLIVWPEDRQYDISRFRKSIKEPVGRRAIRWLEANDEHWLEKLTRVRGKRVERLFWQPGGGYDRNVDDPDKLHTMINYLHHNPVRRNLVTSPTQWLWSSARWYDHQHPGPCQIHPLTEMFT